MGAAARTSSGGETGRGTGRAAGEAGSRPTPIEKNLASSVAPVRYVCVCLDHPAWLKRVNTLVCALGELDGSLESCVVKMDPADPDALWAELLKAKVDGTTVLHIETHGGMSEDEVPRWEFCRTPGWAFAMPDGEQLLAPRLLVNGACGGAGQHARIALPRWFTVGTPLLGSTGCDPRCKQAHVGRGDHDPVCEKKAAARGDGKHRCVNVAATSPNVTRQVLPVLTALFAGMDMREALAAAPKTYGPDRAWDLNEVGACESAGSCPRGGLPHP